MPTATAPTIHTDPMRHDAKAIKTFLVDCMDWLIWVAGLRSATDSGSAVSNTAGAVRSSGSRARLKSTASGGGVRGHQLAEPSMASQPLRTP